VRPINRKLPHAELAFCFPCQPLDSFEWDASAARGHRPAEGMFKLAARRLEDRSLAPPTRLQVVTFTSAAAYGSLLLARGPLPVICMPHSMGFYAALVTAGVCDFEPMLQYVIDAGQAIHEFSQGGDYEMTSVLGIEDEQMEDICREVEGAFVANYNSTGHTVISGKRYAVEEVCRIAIEKDCYDTRPLNTGVPLHTPIMDPVSLVLAKKLAGFPVHEPRSTVFCPYRLVPLEAADIIPALSEHISRPVRFEQMVHKVAEAGVKLILEVGYEKLLSKFINWIDPNIKARSVGSAKALEREIRRFQRAGAV